MSSPTSVDTDDHFYKVFNSAFWLSITALTFSFLGLVIRHCYKTKCKKINCWGIIIERDTDNEELSNESQNDLIPMQTL